MLEDFPSTFSLKEQVSAMSGIYLFKESFRFQRCQASVGILSLENEIIAKDNVDFFIKFMRQTFGVELKCESREKQKGTLGPDISGYSYCDINIENLNSIMAVEILDAKNRAKSVYQNWKIWNDLKLQIKNWVGQVDVRGAAEQVILKQLKIDESKPGFWEGVVKLRDVTAEEKITYQELKEIIDAGFGKDACSLEYNVGANGKEAMILTIKINNAPVSNMSSSSMLSAVSSSAQSQMGVGSNPEPSVLNTTQSGQPQPQNLPLPSKNF